MGFVDCCFRSPNNNNNKKNHLAHYLSSCSQRIETDDFLFGLLKNSTMRRPTIFDLNHFQQHKL